MPIVANPYDYSAFSLLEMTEAINRLPYNIYSLTGDLNIFGAEMSVRTRLIEIEERGGTLNLLPSVPPGAPPTLNHSAKRKVKAFSIPRIPLDDVVLPDDVAGLRGFDTVDQFESVAGKVTEKLVEMKAKMDITREWLRMGALKGILYDGDGSTVLYNFFTEFGISPYVVSFTFSSTTFDVLGTITNVKRHMEDFLHGDFMTGVYCLASPGFYDALVSHPQVRDAYKFYQTNQALSGDYRNGFKHGDVTFREYRGNATDLTGTTRKFIADGEAHFFPLGTRTTFRGYNAPANFNETVNTPGLPYYAKMEARKFNEGMDLRTESNPFYICIRPELLVRATIA
jgi:hypothetical protein